MRAYVYVCINTVIVCSGVCMNWYRVGTLLKGRVCVFYVRCLHRIVVTQCRQCAQVTGWQNRGMERKQDKLFLKKVRESDRKGR